MDPLGCRGMRWMQRVRRTRHIMFLAQYCLSSQGCSSSASPGSSWAFGWTEFKEAAARTQKSRWSFWVYFRSSDTTKITQLGRKLWLPGFCHAVLVSKFQNTKQIFKATNRVALMFPSSFLSWLGISSILSMVLSLFMDFCELWLVLGCPSQEIQLCGGSWAAQHSLDDLFSICFVNMQQN